MSDLEKSLKRMKVTLKTSEQPSTPAHGFTPATRNWRVTLSRDVGEEKPLRLTLTILAPTEPTLATVIVCLAKDIEDGDMSLWDFAQTYSMGKTDPGTERMHKACKRTAPRVKRLFGTSWGLLTNKALSEAA
jgi:hypothetical protein